MTGMTCVGPSSQQRERVVRRCLRIPNKIDRKAPFACRCSARAGTPAIPNWLRWPCWSSSHNEIGGPALLRIPNKIDRKTPFACRCGIQHSRGKVDAVPIRDRHRTAISGNYRIGCSHVRWGVGSPESTDKRSHFQSKLLPTIGRHSRYPARNQFCRNEGVGFAAGILC